MTEMDSLGGGNLENIDASTEGIVIKEASANIGMARLLLMANKAKGVVQIFEPEKVINRMHLIGAYANSIQAFKSKTNISRKMGMEMLLFAAMTKQIGRAIDTIGARSESDFIVFANGREAYATIKPYLRNARDFKPPRRRITRIAGLYGINAGNREDIDKLVLQKMAVSRLEV
jgi:tRNA threonylcarbamoyladenosine modification (KEOPS) complex Cgi121 subunit